MTRAKHLRRHGISVLVIEHRSAGGQRGSPRKLLDLMVAPTSSDTRQGAQRISVEFSVSVRINDSEAMVINLAGDDTPRQHSCSSMSTFDKVLERANAGMRPVDIAADLQVTRSTVSRHLSRAREESVGPPKPPRNARNRA